MGQNGRKFEPRRVSKPFCDFLADPDSHSFSFSRFEAIIIVQSAVKNVGACLCAGFSKAKGGKGFRRMEDVKKRHFCAIYI
jgi:hypothetical protein